MKIRSAYHRLLVATLPGIACLAAAHAEQPEPQGTSGPLTVSRLLKITGARQGQIIAGRPLLGRHPYPEGNEGPASEEWKGSFGVPGLRTRLKVSGFVELNVIHDNRAITTPSAFVTSAILTGEANRASGGGRTISSIQPTRLALETRTPVSGHRLRTFASADFFDDYSGTTPRLRLRQAYGEISNVLFGGDILVGQAWSTYADLVTFPPTLDFQGPNSFIGGRHPLVRWTTGLGKGPGGEIRVKLAAEAPDLRIFEGGADVVTKWPDGVAALTWDRGPYHLMATGFVRDLRASFRGGPVATTVGWGASLTGNLQMPDPVGKDAIKVSLTYGEGIGGLMNDGLPDAVYDPATGGLNTIPTLGWFASYQHFWTPILSTTVVYGSLSQDNADVQPGKSVKQTRYVSANLVWAPWEQWLFGFEVLYGRREDKNGNSGPDVRTQFTSRFTF